MTTSHRTQSALRAALQKEDAALVKRLPDTAAKRATTPIKDSPGGPAVSEPTPARKPAVRRRTTGASAAAKADAVARKPKKVAESPSGGVARPPVTPAAGPVADAAVAEPPRAEKRVREDFVLSVKDVERLRRVQSAVEKAAPKPSRSALLRVAVRLLGEQDPATLATVLEGLPPLKKKGKRGKK
ncbi:hypothetical protein ACKVEX_09685 [Rhodocyclaceae bacterium SMB388]